MNKRCTCGLINFGDAEVCRRCGAALTDSSLAQNRVPSQPAAAVQPLPYTQDGIINQSIGRCNRNLTITNVCILVALVGLLLVSGKYYCNFFMGAAAIDEHELSRMTSSAGRFRNYVKVSGGEIFDTGMEQVKTKTRNGVKVSEDVEARYSVIEISDKLLLIKTPVNDAKAVIGELVDMPNFEQSQILSQLYAKEPDLRGTVLPVMLDATDYRTPGTIGLIIGIPLLVLAIWNMKKAADRKANPETHPLMRGLERFGNPRAIAAHIDHEVKTCLYGANLSAVSVTPSWLLSPTFFTVKVMAMKDIVWVYKKVTKHYYNFIPTGKTYATLIADRHGKTMEINSNRSESNTDSAMEQIHQRAPWVIFGFDDGLAATWQSTPNEFVRAVDARRAEFEQQMAQQV
jgi:hypothetical protein